MLKFKRSGQDPRGDNDSFGNIVPVQNTVTVRTRITSHCSQEKIDFFGTKRTPKILGVDFPLDCPVQSEGGFKWGKHPLNHRLLSVEQRRSFVYAVAPNPTT